MRSLLIVDDEADARFTLRQMLRKLECTVLEASDGVTALEVIKENLVDLVISDIRMPRMDGMRLLKEIKGTRRDIEVLLITAYGEIQDAVAAMKEGAYDYICKPVSKDELVLKVEKALMKKDLERQVAYFRERERSQFNYGEIVGTSSVMQQLYRIIEKVHSTDSSILVRGESGTGKELVARAIHYKGVRSDKPFIKVNPAALAEGVLESELFGHERGAFTGAHSSKPGRCELANEGTLFLDEIADIPLGIQAKLLRFLEEKVFERVGGNRTIKADVRIIAATNADLERLVREGRFREDLFFRLNVIPIFLPPLRHRKEDVPLLVNYFMGVFNQELKKEIEGIQDKALSKMEAHHWPGNVRELKNVIERAMVLTEDKILGADGIILSEVDRVKADIERDEKARLIRALEEANGNKSEAARRLGMDRRTYEYRLKKFFGPS